MALFVLLVALSACQASTPPTPTLPNASATPVPSATHMPSATPTPNSTVTVTPKESTPLPPTATPTLTPSATPSATPTPDPYAGLTIADLRARSYGGGVFEVVESLGAGPDFSRDLVRYDSDGLFIHGFMNTPRGEGPFPVAIVLHGYIDPAVYTTLAYTTRYADALARAGYLVIHPNLRNYPPSDSGPNEFHVGMAIDVLNLMALVQAGQGPLAAADGERMALMGHSMGGGITWRVIAVTDAVDGAVLYGSMSADEAVNIAQRKVWRAERGQPAPTGEPDGAPDDPTALDLRRISPGTYVAEIDTPISIHHSDADATVPPEWSAQAYAALTALGKDVEYYRYQNTPHTFRGEQDALFIERMVAFFDRHVKGE